MSVRRKALLIGVSLSALTLSAVAPVAEAAPTPGDKSVYAWGDNDFFRAGLPEDAKDYATAEEVCHRAKCSNRADMSKATEVAAGERHSLALLNDGSLWAWGEDDDGRLGIGDHNQNAAHPTEVKLCAADFECQGVKQPSAVPKHNSTIAAGMGHSLAILEDGSVVAWGIGDNGRLGTGNEDDQSVPQMACSVYGACRGGAKDVAAGEAHSLALLTNGDVYAWGENDDGRLGTDDPDHNGLVPRKVDLGGKATAISAGARHSVALMANGDVKVWGSNNERQLGSTGFRNPSWTPQTLPDFTYGDRIVDVVAGYNYTLALTESGHVFGWGQNDQGQLAQGNDHTVDRPTRLCDTSGCPAQLDGIEEVAAGREHTLALSREGVVYAWGDNDRCELAAPRWDKRLTPGPIAIEGTRRGFTGISAGWTFSLAVRAADQAGT